MVLQALAARRGMASPSSRSELLAPLPRASEAAARSSSAIVCRPRTRLAGVSRARLAGERSTQRPGLSPRRSRGTRVASWPRRPRRQRHAGTNGSTPGSAATAFPFALVERREPGKSEAVCPSAPMPFTARSRNHARECRVVARRGLLRAELALDPVHGLRRPLEPVEEPLAREPVVGALVVRRDRPLVAPPRLPPCSSRARELRLARTHRRPRAAREGDAALRDAPGRRAARRRSAPGSSRTWIVDASSLLAARELAGSDPSPPGWRRGRPRGRPLCSSSRIARDRRAAGRGYDLAQLDGVHLLVAQLLCRAEHRLDDELRRDLAREAEQDPRPRSSPPRGGRSRPGPSRKPR